MSARPHPSDYDLLTLPPSYRPWSAAVQDFAETDRRWLTTRRMRHSFDSRRQLALARPDLFGRQPEIALHGYDRWLQRQRLPDSIESFARYLEPRLTRLNPHGVVIPYSSAPHGRSRQ